MAKPSKGMIIYYLTSILRQLRELRKEVPDEMGLSLENMALADNIDWLDCYIDQLQRELPK